MITGDLHEPILLVQTILLLQDEGDITGLFTYVINLISDTKDLQSAFCLRPGFGFHDDGEPVVKSYVCENGPM